MNKLTIAAASIILALGSASAFADDTVTTPGTDVGLITFDGAVSDTTCTITTNNGVDARNVTISMPVVKKPMSKAPPSTQALARKSLNCT